MGVTRVILSPASRARRQSTLVLGPVVVLLAAAALFGVRGTIDNSAVALILGVVVVGCGLLGGEVAAVVCSIVAAVSFDLWHTQPYGSLKIDSVTDMVITAMLIVLGIVTGRFAEMSWRHRDQEQLRVGQLDHLHRIAELAVAAEDAAAIWPTVRDTLCHELHLGTCWFEPARHQGVRSRIEFAEMAHNGTITPGLETMRWSPSGFELPRNGVELSLVGGGRHLGRLVLLPDPGHGLSLVDRCFAVAVADQFSLVAVREDDLPVLT